MANINTYDQYKAGATIADIIKELTYELNRYCKDCDEIAIYDVNDEETAEFNFYKVVNIDDKYQLEA